MEHQGLFSQDHELNFDQHKAVGKRYGQLAFQVRFQWEPDSVAFWVNRCVQHLAVWGYFPQSRSGYRLMIEGDRLV